MPASHRIARTGFPPRQIGRIVLAVAVERRDPRALAAVEACFECRRLASPPAMRDKSHYAEAGGQRKDFSGCSVGATVVNDHDFIVRGRFGLRHNRHNFID
jgi:hypothetical protein